MNTSAGARQDTNGFLMESLARMMPNRYRQPDDEDLREGEEGYGAQEAVDRFR